MSEESLRRIRNGLDSFARDQKYYRSVILSNHCTQNTRKQEYRDGQEHGKPDLLVCGGGECVDACDGGRTGLLCAVVLFKGAWAVVKENDLIHLSKVLAVTKVFLPRSDIIWRISNASPRFQTDRQATPRQIRPHRLPHIRPRAQVPPPGKPPPLLLNVLLKDELSN